MSRFADMTPISICGFSMAECSRASEDETSDGDKHVFILKQLEKKLGSSCLCKMLLKCSKRWKKKAGALWGFESIANDQ